MNGGLEVSFTPARLNIKAQKEALSDRDDDDDQDYEDYEDDEGDKDDDDDVGHELWTHACCLERATTIAELTRT